MNPSSSPPGGVQQEIPGINRKKLAYEGLLSKNPMPENLADAQKFLRDHCDTLIKWKSDHDFFRAVLKTHNSDADKEKHEYTCELPLNNPETYTQKLVEKVQQIYYAWLDIEAPKQ